MGTGNSSHRADGEDEANAATAAASSDRHEDADAASLKAGGPGCGLVYDEGMLGHRGPPDHPEQPERIVEIWKQLDEAGLIDACTCVRGREASDEQLRYVHTPEHVERVIQSGKKQPPATKGNKPSFSFPFDEDTYVCNGTPKAARLAAGCLLSLVDAALDPESPVRCGMAVVRPPGHHAAADQSSGFCLFNNIAIAARHLQREHGLQKIMIIDWDVHHGNGTSEIFVDDADVLFFSLHRYDCARNSAFFPGTGSLSEVGKSAAAGYTVNVPLSKGYSDIDVCHVMRHILCPLVERFKPEAILVSAGFDAVHSDPLGGCHQTPNGFAWMTRFLYRLARQHCKSRLFLALEGGYNCDMIARCTVQCARALVLELADAAPAEGEFPPLPEVTGTAVLTPLIQQTSLGNPSLLEGGSNGNSMAKVRMPTWKTAQNVRKLSEVHSELGLQLPLAPKAPKQSSQLCKGSSLVKNGRPKQKGGNHFTHKSSPPKAGLECRDDSFSSESEPEADISNSEAIAAATLWQNPTNGAGARHQRRKFSCSHYYLLSVPVLMLIAWSNIGNVDNSEPSFVPQSSSSALIEEVCDSCNGEQPEFDVSDEGSRLRDLIRGVYERRNPAKLSTLDALLDKHKGKERQVYETVCRKYGEIPDPEAPKGEPRHRKSSDKKTADTDQVSKSSSLAKGNYYIRNSRVPGETKVIIPITSSVKSRDIDVDFAATSLKVNIRGLGTVIDRELSAPIRVEESSWEIDKRRGQRVCIVTLTFKNIYDHVPELFKPDTGGSKTTSTTSSTILTSTTTTTASGSMTPSESAASVDKAFDVEQEQSAAHDEQKYYTMDTKVPGETKLYILIASSVKSKDINVEITATSLRVTIRGHGVIVDREFLSPILADESSWEIDRHRGKRVCIITVERKNANDKFLELFKPTTTTTTAAITTSTTTTSTNMVGIDVRGQDSDTKPSLVQQQWKHYVRYTKIPGEIKVYIPITSSVKSKDIHVEFTATTLKVQVRGHGTVIDREFWSLIRAGESSWEIDKHRGKRVCIVTALKKNPSEDASEVFKPLRTASEASTPITTQSTTPELRAKGAEDEQQFLPEAGEHYVRNTKVLGEAKVYIPIASSVKARDINVEFTSVSLRVVVRGGHGPLLDRELAAPIHVDKSSWEIGYHRGKRVCILTVLKKDTKSKFPELFKPDSGLSVSPTITTSHIPSSVATSATTTTIGTTTSPLAAVETEVASQAVRDGNVAASNTKKAATLVDGVVFFDNGSEIEVRVPIGSNVKSKDIKVDMTTTKLRVNIKGRGIVIAGQLWRPILPEQSSWEIAKIGGKRWAKLSMMKKFAGEKFTKLLQGL